MQSTEPRYADIVCGFMETALNLDGEVYNRCTSLDEGFAHHFNKLVPVLPPSASQQQCLRAEADVREAYDVLQPVYHENFHLMAPRVQSQIELFEHVVCLADLFQGALRTTSDRTAVANQRKRAMVIIDIHRRRTLELHDLQAKNQLYSHLHNLVRDQNDELRQWYETRLAKELAGHVTRYTGTLRSCCTISSRGSSITPEIMLLVYSFCDIESCASLRQVDTQWYSIFQHMEAILRSKVMKRNPWLKPDGKDLQTWADCALVLAARLKWPHVDHMDKLAAVVSNPTVRKSVGTIPLGSHDRLPHDFEGMLPLQGHCLRNSVACDHFHVPSKYREHIQDMRTLELQETLENHEVDLPVVRCKGLEITLSPQTRAEDIVDFHPMVRDDIPVEVFSKTAIVRFKNGSVLAVPRDAPSYENGLTFNVADPFIVELGGVLHIMTGGDIGDTTQVVDMESKQIHVYANVAESIPAAVHKGLFWWTVGKRMLIPTFLDVETQHLHYDPKRAVGYDDPGDSATWFQGKGNSCKYAIGVIDGNRELVDLDTGVVTTLRGLPEGLVCIPGFVGGKFCVYSLSYNEDRKRKEAIWKELGIPEQEWEDGSEDDSE